MDLTGFDATVIGAIVAFITGLITTTDNNLKKKFGIAFASFMVIMIALLNIFDLNTSIFGIIKPISSPSPPSIMNGLTDSAIVSVDGVDYFFSLETSEIRRNSDGEAIIAQYGSDEPVQEHYTLAFAFSDTSQLAYIQFEKTIKNRLIFKGKRVYTALSSSSEDFQFVLTYQEDGRYQGTFSANAQESAGNGYVSLDGKFDFTLQLG